MQREKLRVLVITSMPWRNDNNIGNSYSNIFGGLQDKIEFAHIYCRSGKPQNDICFRYFQINENDLIQNILKKKPLGKAFDSNESINEPMEIFSSSYNKMRILRWEIFFICRNLLWDLADWKTERLDAFVENFKPDLIFGTLTYMPNINKMMLYLKEKYNIPLVVYSWDDVYSLHQFSISPLFWIRRFSQRKWIKKCVLNADKMYAIDEMMKEEYEKYFRKDIDILYKGYKFDENYEAPIVNKPIKFVFMGNLGAGRWIALYELAEILNNINREKQTAVLEIYSLSPISDEMNRKLNIKNTSCIKAPVANEMVFPTMKSADILVHVEPLNIKDALFYRLSFSTKLVDYFKAGRCILGFGRKTASLEYLIQNNAGIVVYDLSKLEDQIREIIDNPKCINEFGYRAWNCGKKNHQISCIQDKLVTDLMKTRGEKQ